jgi:Protein of unknown function (DUF3568)
MKTNFFAALAGIAIVATGCIGTVSGTKTAAVVPFTKDRVEGRYERSVDQVYQASVAVIQNNGVIITEFIPHDTTNVVRSLQGKVNQRNVWVKVEAVDPKITSVTVQARTAMNSDVDLAHQLEKEIALQLAR